jgi:hypothetical protein
LRKSRCFYGCNIPSNVSHSSGKRAKFIPGLKHQSFLLPVSIKHERCHDVSGYILEDKNTGIKYLYIWVGRGGHGPAITRYWEKEESHISQ